MPEITLPVQKAEKVIKPPVKSLQLGDGYEQTFQNAIADVEEWNVTTPPMDDADANSLEDLLNGLNGDVFTWTPPFSDPGTYRLNSKITRTMVSYMRSTLQFSLKKAAIEYTATCTPRSRVFESNFNSDSWELFYLENYDGGNGIGTIAEADLSIVSGGNSGNCARIQLDFGGVNNAGIIAVWKSSYYYVPQHPDEILSFGYSEDQKFVSSDVQGQGWWFCVIQNGIVKSKFAGVTGNNPNWNTKTVTATAIELGLDIIPNVPICFGIMRSNQNGVGNSAITQTVALVDNWSVTVNVTCG